MINKQLGDLNLMKNFGCTVTRVRRSGIDLSPSPDLALKFGDKLMVVGEKKASKAWHACWAMQKAAVRHRLLPHRPGHRAGRALRQAEHLLLPDGLSFSPGLTGGILMVALFLSAIGKTGPILWSMSGPGQPTAAPAGTAALPCRSRDIGRTNLDGHVSRKAAGSCSA